MISHHSVTFVIHCSVRKLFLIFVQEQKVSVQTPCPEVRSGGWGWGLDQAVVSLVDRGSVIRGPTLVLWITVTWNLSLIQMWNQTSFNPTSISSMSDFCHRCVWYPSGIMRPERQRFSRQGDLVNNIEKNVASTAEYISQTRAETQTAVRYKKNPFVVASLPNFLKTSMKKTNLQAQQNHSEPDQT